MAQLNEDIRKTLESLDQLERLEMTPLAANRIWERAQVEGKSPATYVHAKIPVAWISGLAAIVILNIMLLGVFGGSERKNTSANQSPQSIYFNADLSY